MKKPAKKKPPVKKVPSKRKPKKLPIGFFDSGFTAAKKPNDGQTHYYGDDCPGGHYDDRHRDLETDADRANHYSDALVDSWIAESKQMYEAAGGLPHYEGSSMEDLGYRHATGAKKADNGKPQLSLIPKEALDLMAQAFAYGAVKYGRNNFRRGHAYSRTLDAALRHLTAIASGNFTDAESGNPHLGHALASLGMLAHAMQHHPHLDDLSLPREDDK